jgi:DNA-binding beta-propeller fold protein YncE
VVGTAFAGCIAARVVVSPNGHTVWVSAAGSDQLLAFSSQELVRDPAHALLAAVRVGAQARGVTIFDHGQRIAVADSGLYARPGAITIVNTEAALDGSPSIIGELPAGVDPRNATLEPNDATLLVINYGSGQLESVDLQQLS